MESIFPSKFSFIDFTPLFDKRDDSFILGILFKDQGEADNWNNLLIHEPYSFTYEVGEIDNWIVFKFTNHSSDYRFQAPRHTKIDPENFSRRFAVLICLADTQELKPLFDPHYIAPLSHN